MRICMTHFIISYHNFNIHIQGRYERDASVTSFAIPSLLIPLVI